MCLPVEKCLPVKKTTLLPHNVAVFWSSITACAVLWRWHTPQSLRVYLGIFDFSIFKPCWTIIVQNSAWQHLTARVFMADIDSNKALTPLLQVGSSSPARSCRILFLGELNLQSKTCGSCSKHRVCPSCTPGMTELSKAGLRSHPQQHQLCWVSRAGTASTAHTWSMYCSGTS